MQDVSGIATAPNRAAVLEMSGGPKPGAPFTGEGGGLGMGCRYHACKKRKRLQLMVINADRLSCPFGRCPVKQGPRSQLGCQGWIEKLTTGPKMMVARKVLKIGTWNVQTLWRAGKLDLLHEDIKPYECDILGIAEMYWTKTGEIGGGEVIWSGEDKDHERGVGLLLSKKARDCLLGYKHVNPRIIFARFSGQPFNIAVIQVYAPTADSSDEDIEEFYSLVESTLKDLPNKDICIVLGDWNAKIGSNNEGLESCMGRYGPGERNERVERLIEFAMKNKLFIDNTRFQQKSSRK